MMKMLKTFAVAAAACMLFSTMAVQAEEVFTIRNNVNFGMNLDQVTAAETARYEDIDSEDTHGPFSFTELEYENLKENDIPCDVKYLFLDDALVAVCFNYELYDVKADEMKNELTEKYGESAALDTELVGNGIYAIDDDGHTNDQIDTWTTEDQSVMIVLKQDDDPEADEDFDVIFLDLTAAYITK